MILQEDQSVNVVVRGLMFKDGHLLVTQWRGNGVMFGIGGRVDFGESVLEATHREVREETGVEIVSKKLLYFSEHIFVNDRGRHYHELGWYFWVEPDREICGLDEIIPNPDHPDLIIRYMKVDQENLSNFWPSFMIEYLPADLAHGFTQNPRHIYSRNNGMGEKLARELTGLFEPG